jgi:hypothetical protein
MGDWPPKTYPRPSELPAPQLDGCPLARGGIGHWLLEVQTDNQ